MDRVLPVAIILAALVVAATFAWLFRFDVHVNDAGGVLRLDRWTGAITVCRTASGRVNCD